MKTFNIVNPNPHGPLEEDQLINFEKFLGETLPSDYRQFILTFNGGTPEPSFFWTEEEKDGTSIHQFYGLYNSPQGSSLYIFIGDDHCGIPKGFLPIADDGVGNSLIIGISGQLRGMIHFLDHEIHPYHQPDSFEGIVKIADSFDAFTELLFARPD